MASIPAAAAPGPNAWLSSPVSDLTLGCGVGYMAAFALLAVAGGDIETLLPLGLMPLALLLLSVPHYGATLLRVYEKPENRRKYQLFAIHLTILVWAIFAAGVYSSFVGSLLLTVYLTWSPWHYSGQNYGISLMFLGRRGVQIPLLAKRLLYASFILTFVLTFIELHASIYGPVIVPDPSDTHYHLTPLGIPLTLANPLIVAIGAAYLVCLACVAYMLLRVAKWRELLPTALIVLSQALWFIVPMFAYHFDVLQDVFPLSRDHAGYVFFWIACAHAVQYLWITSYFAKRSDNRPSSEFFGKCLLAGSIIWVVPALLFSPALFGRLSFDEGLGALVAAAVNLHHFILDGAIWKLRDGRIARVLLRSASDSESVSARTGRWTRIARAGFAVAGVAAVLIYYLGTIEEHFGVARAAEAANLERMRVAVDRLSWMGRDSAGNREQLAQIELRSGNLAAAERQFRKAVELDESVPLLNRLAEVQYRIGEVDSSVRTVQRSLHLARKSGQQAEVERLSGALRQLQSPPAP
jgi:hypothetical protein